ncbi:hypothetical protein GCM10009734_81620 [Nonomuraea bangladeshensis]
MPTKAPRTGKTHRMYPLEITTPSLIALTAVITAAAIWLAILAVRLTQRPRNRLNPSIDLVDQARELKALGQIQEAVFLVRGETGMSQRAAARFVNRL